ncbi:MAG: hypothetical protein IPK56_11030 [Elusimicrobia bacterium]|nr:hypothetical protein [Elusimicrobiota bacterium]
MNAAALEKMARETRALFPASQGEVEVDRVLAAIQGMEKKTSKAVCTARAKTTIFGRWPSLSLASGIPLAGNLGHFRRVAGDLAGAPLGADGDAPGAVGRVSAAVPRAGALP